MNRQKVKDFMDTCYYAKRICDLMAELPPHMKPRHIHVIDAIMYVQGKGIQPTVTDVSERLNVTMPSVTKLIHELESLKVLEKHRDVGDKRIIYLKLTELGYQYHKLYVEDYLDWLSDLFAEVPMEEIDITIETITRIYSIMQKNKMNFKMES